MFELYSLLLGVVMVYMSLWFLIGRLVGRYDVADSAWGLGFVVVAWMAFALSGNSSWLGWLSTVLVTMWGVRLSLHIFLRNYKKPEDTRYQRMRQKWTTMVHFQAYIRIFIVQGLLLYIISLPVIAAHTTAPQSIMWWHYAGFFVWLLGFLFEVISDYQLRHFIQSPLHKDQLMQAGLWRYSRHPNYFGEAIQWWGLFLLALQGGWTWLTVISPIVITFLLTKVSGVPLLERKMRRHPDFTDYKRRTSVFIPLPPRK